MKLISWNINGIRAGVKKGFLDWFLKTCPEILALQETKAWPEQLTSDVLNPGGYYSYWAKAQRKGYSGVVLYSKQEPLDVRYGFGDKKFDSEGRIIIAEYEKFFLYNIYFPNGQMNDQRLEYKLEFYDAFLKHYNLTCKRNKTVIVCGDVNTAHKEIDLARPQANRNVSGFLEKECAWLDKFLKAGMVDTFRHFDKRPDNYTWWSMRTRARERNVGWRLDYFYIDKNSVSKLKKASILNEVMGSDHCPISIDIDN